MSGNETYPIRTAAEMTGLSEDTIRYYEKIGLLPHALRRENRHRVYDQGDIERMNLITCLKKTGMSLDEMRPFLDRPREELADTPELFDALQRHRENILNQMASLQQIVDFIDQALIHKTAAEEECTLKGDRKRMPVKKDTEHAVRK
ncbi:MerR family transcriptional regulator [Paenibacillus stellifer]|uniref:MerR family transcriptional regulator n=1 Tax=Paenibacillus stellifer TaxID=169760 RepID=UPI000689DB6F|nr:MerR family transcriptional regulator [Paenibacillus stellifer]